MANLTLTAYNSKYSNAPFSEKKTMEDGYLQSGIRMTQWVAQKEHWGLPELEERCKYLTQQAMSLWPYADSSYTPPQKQYEEVSLDDDITLTGHSIVKYRFRGIEHETTSWVEMYTEVLKELHNGNKAYLNYLADADDSVDLSIQVTRSPDEFSSSVKIDDNIYIWTGTATQYKVNLLRKFFEQYKQDPSDLVFFLDDSKGIGSDEEIERYKIRRKYWESVLPSLQEATGTFLNISPSKNITTNILFFDRTHPTTETWFYRLDMPEGYKNFSKTKPMKLEHFAPAVEWWDNREEITIGGFDKAKKYSVEELKARNYNIDLCGYPHEEEEILPPKELILQYQEKRASLNADIDRILAQITDILGIDITEEAAE